MKKVCLWGTSLKKPGDEAQVLAIIKLLKKKHPNVQIRLFSKYESLLDQISSYKDGSVKAVRTNKVISIYKSLRNSDFLLFIGAPFYEEYKQAFTSFYLYLFTSFLHVKRACFAITIFPFSTNWGKKWYQFLFNKMEFIVVRDQAALSVFQGLDLNLKVSGIPDLRYVLELPGKERLQQLLKGEKIDPNKLIVGFTTRYLSPDIPQWVKKSQGYSVENVKNINSILAQIGAYFEDKAQILVFPMHPLYADDQKMAVIISDQMKESDKVILLKTGYRAKELIALIGQCDFLIASRAGSTIFGSAAHVPMLGIAFDDRLKAFMKDFEISEFVVDWKNVTWPEVKDILDKLLAEKSIIKQKLEEKTSVIKAEINQKFESYFS